MKKRLDELRATAREEALGRGVSPRDVDLLLCDVTSRPLSWIVAHGESLIDPQPLESLLARRYGGEPLQYIRGRTEFYAREFLVDSRVLIPRPETELVVDEALHRAPPGAFVIDVGTGSGCIAISVERERPDLHVIGVDRSAAALSVAATNVRRLGSRVRLLGSDLLTAIRRRPDVIVSNPPYVPAAEYETLDAEVRVHEPRLALSPGPRGTEVIEKLLQQAQRILAPGGLLIMEVGYGQEPAVRQLALGCRFDVDAFLPDLAGIPRVIVLSRHGDQRELSLLPDRE